MLRCSLQVEIPHLEEHHHHPSCNDLCALYLVVSCVYVKNMYIYIYTPYKYIYTVQIYFCTKSCMIYNRNCVHSPIHQGSHHFPHHSLLLVGHLRPGQWADLSTYNHWKSGALCGHLAAVKHGQFMKRFSWYGANGSSDGTHSWWKILETWKTSKGHVFVCYACILLQCVDATVVQMDSGHDHLGSFASWWSSP